MFNQKPDKQCTLKFSGVLNIHDYQMTIMKTGEHKCVHLLAPKLDDDLPNLELSCQKLISTNNQSFFSEASFTWWML